MDEPPVLSVHSQLSVPTGKLGGPPVASEPVMFGGFPGPDVKHDIKDSPKINTLGAFILCHAAL